MKVFVSYAFTGEDFDKLGAMLLRLKQMFNDLGIDHYINLYDPIYQSLVDNDASGGEYLRTALTHMPSCDTVLVLNT